MTLKRCTGEEVLDKLKPSQQTANPEMKQRKDTALRWLRFSLGAVLIVPVLLFAYVAVTSYRAAFQLADKRRNNSDFPSTNS